MKSLEQYLREEMSEGKIDFIFRAHSYQGGPVEIYIHPYNRDGSTTPLMIVEGNTVREKIWPPIGPDAGPDVPGGGANP